MARKRRRGEPRGRPQGRQKMVELKIPELRHLRQKIRRALKEHPDISTNPDQMGDLSEEECLIVDFARTGALKFLANDSNLRGVGLGGTAEQPALVYLAANKRRAEQALPEEVKWKGKKLRVEVLEMLGDIYTAQGPTGAFIRQTGALSGSAMSNDASGDGGTLGGTFNPLFGSGQRGSPVPTSPLAWGSMPF